MTYGNGYQSRLAVLLIFVLASKKTRGGSWFMIHG